MNNIIKKCLPDVLVVMLFVAISFAYFLAPTFEGKILFQHDHSAGRGMNQDIEEHKKNTGEVSRWSNTVFSGMPTYQSAPSYDSQTPVTLFEKILKLGLPEYAGYLFMYLLGFYIMLRAFNFRQHLAALGSILWAFSTYFLIIIAAGHLWKVMALSYLPPLIGGLVLCYRGKYLWGMIVTAVFTALEIHANHVQMTYYYLFIIAFMAIAWAWESYSKKTLTNFYKAAAAAFVGAVIGLSLNLSNLYHTWEYSKETMRGKSELVKENSADQTDSGLDRSYITNWSYGIGETWTLLVPNTKGGASVPLGLNETAMKECDQNLRRQFATGANFDYCQLSQYFGEQPGTSGPVYVGAFVLMLAILAMFIVKNPIKWALFAATILSIMLSWGKNFQWFTDLFIDYMPMFAKFRTISSILVVAEFCIPLLAIMAMKRIVEEPEVLTKRLWPLSVSLALTGGMAFLFAIMPDVFFGNYITSNEMQMFSGLPASYQNPLLENISDMRRAMFTSDCWRSFIIILLGTACLLLYKAKRLKLHYMIAAVMVICLVDLWQVNKRYLNDEMFVEKKEKTQPVKKPNIAQYAYDDTDPNFRVFNISQSRYSENETSYYFNSIGGYHPAKLRRYQDMIDRYIEPEVQPVASSMLSSEGDLSVVSGDSLFPVLNMLNTKYFALNLPNIPSVTAPNPHAMGNAWFVDRVEYVGDANAEIDLVGKLALRHEAVADQKFETILGQSQSQDSTSYVRLTDYSPNRIAYEAQSTKGGIIVFSEIYYPGWTATIDGEPAEVGRVNYILRAINMPAGQHKIELMFDPTSLSTTEGIAYLGYAVLILALVFVIYTEYKRRRK